MKILRKIKDKHGRYNFEAREERQKCLLEGLEWNSKFTSDIPIGLGRICKLGPHHICIDQIVRTPTEVKLDPNAEYTLLMKQLPAESRLDNLLYAEEGEVLPLLLRLVDRIAKIHKNIIVPPEPRKDGILWGSIEQLQEKLEHNLILFKQVFAENDNQHYHRYFDLAVDLHQIMQRSEYRHYFEQRIREQRIGRCHGDLKSSNIWCTEKIYILDAIDFNPTYCNIDVLSDLAMLIADVQARLIFYYSQKSTVSFEFPLEASTKLTDSMIQHYLEYTEQQNEAAHAVLEYYIVEKALVGAAVSILDTSPGLAQAFFRVAEIHIGSMKHQ
jgi:aminoglycoside phosphotransferase family enzyme